MSYEYMLTIKKFEAIYAPNADHAFFSSFHGNPHAAYKSNKEILFKESLDADYSHHDLRLVLSTNFLVIQINRKCEALYKLFSTVLNDSHFSIYEEDELERNVPLLEVFRL
jgi:hypothetical protein